MSHQIIIQGELALNPKLSPSQRAYLSRFSNTRRMKRNNNLLIKEDDDLRTDVNLPLGVDSEYYVGSPAAMGQDFDNPSVVAVSEPPGTQPGLWCGWSPNRTGTKLVWNRNIIEFEPPEWLAYIINHFLKPWNIVCNGSIKYYFESDVEIVYSLISDANHISYKMDQKGDRKQESQNEDILICIRGLGDTQETVRLDSAEALPFF